MQPLISSNKNLDYFELNESEIFNLICKKIIDVNTIQLQQDSLINMGYSLIVDPINYSYSINHNLASNTKIDSSSIIKILLSNYNPFFPLLQNSNILIIDTIGIFKESHFFELDEFKFKCFNQKVKKLTNDNLLILKEYSFTEDNIKFSFDILNSSYYLNLNIIYDNYKFQVNKLRVNKKH